MAVGTLAASPCRAIACAVALPTLRLHQNKNAPGHSGAFSCPAVCAALILLEEARKLLLEPRNAAAAIHDLLGAAGPGRMRFRVDVEAELVAGLAPGRPRLGLGPVVHHDRNHMIIRANFRFNGISLWRRAPVL